MSTHWLACILEGRRQMVAGGHEPRFVYVSEGAVQEIQREIGDLFAVEHSGHYIGGMPIIERPDLLPNIGDWAISCAPAPGI